MINKKETTLENVPTQLNANEVYCLGDKSQTISIAKIIGKSAKYNECLYVEINERLHRISATYFDKHRVYSIPSYGITLYKNYQGVIKKYNEIQKKEANKKKVRKSKTVKYLVHNSTFFCRKSTCANTYCEKVFDTQAEAEEYAKKKLAALKKQVDKYLPLANELLKKLEAKKAKLYSYETYGKKLYMSQMQAFPTDVKLGDELFKIKLKKIGKCYFQLGELDKDCNVFVKDIIKPNEIAQLSDGTLLVRNECGSIYPYFFKKEKYNSVINLLKNININTLKTIINDAIGFLNITKEYAEKYEPFKKGESEPRVNFKYRKNEIDEICKLIDNFEWI